MRHYCPSAPDTKPTDPSTDLKPSCAAELESFGLSWRETMVGSALLAIARRPFEIGAYADAGTRQLISKRTS